MSETEGPSDPDRMDGVAHPRETMMLFGHEGPQRAFLEAWNADRLHHAWLLRGAPGIGRATFAYRVARFALSQPGPEAAGAGLFGEAPPRPTSLEADPDGPTARQIAAGAHPGLRELRRPFNTKTGKFGKAISVDDIRELKSFFQLSAAEGGWRAALIDPADDLNAAAANALLKLLEEPPARALFLLVSSAAGRLPATIRSRCRLLDFRPLSEADAQAALTSAAPEHDAAAAARLLRLAPGAPGEALRLEALGGAGLYDEILDLLSGLPRLDRRKLFALADEVRDADALAGVGRLLRLALERLARAGALGTAEAGGEGANDPREAALTARLAPSAAAARAWAEAAAMAFEQTDQALRLNLDPGRTIFDTALRLEAFAETALAAAGGPAGGAPSAR